MEWDERVAGTFGRGILFSLFFSNPFFGTNLECKQEKSGNEMKSPYLIQEKKTYLSSDRDSIAVDRGRARDGFYSILYNIMMNEGKSFDCLRQLIDAR
jgi:hypothetical protein